MQDCRPISIFGVIRQAWKWTAFWKMDPCSCRSKLNRGKPLILIFSQISQNGMNCLETIQLTALSFMGEKKNKNGLKEVYLVGHGSKRCLSLLKKRNEMDFFMQK